MLNTKPKLVLVGIAAIVVALLLIRNSGLRHTASAPEQNRSSADKRSPQPGTTSNGRLRQIGNSNTSHEPNAAPADAIADELILLFPNARDRDAFLAKASENGLTVKGVNRVLNAVRLSVGDNDEANLARKLAGPQAETESNYTVLIPFPVTEENAYQSVPFEANALRFMGVPEQNAAWGKGVTIAILDTGILDHNTLKDVSIRRIDLVDTNSNQTPISPHGTAVASLIFGQSGNGIAPGANALSIRVLDSDGLGDTFTLAQGIVEAVDQGAQIINMSLGSFGYSSLLENAVRYANDRGVALVASSGNESATTLPFPAQFESVLAVSAIDAAGQFAPFSNQGQATDIAAPGVGVYAAWAEEQWASFSGTSAAAPYVAGSLAALVSEFPGLSARDAAARLLANANDTGAPGQDPQTGAGYVDLERALRSPQDRVTDVALANIYLRPADGAVFITAQNRGTQTLSSVTLDYQTDGEPTQHVLLGQLAAGEVASYEITHVQGRVAAGTLQRIEASVQTSAATQDDNPRNNARKLTLSPIEE